MIATGFVFAIVSGLTLPAQIALYGQMLDIFLYHHIATVEVNNTSIAALAQSATTLLNKTCNSTAVVESGIFEPFRNSSRLLCEAQNQQIFDNIVNFACDPDSQLQGEVRVFSYYFLILASCTLVGTFLGTLFWNVSAYRQTRRIRQTLYLSILHQEVGWFDVNNSNELVNRLVEYVTPLYWTKL